MSRGLGQNWENQLELEEIVRTEQVNDAALYPSPLTLFDFPHM